jgi:hypothetical protein
MFDHREAERESERSGLHDAPGDEVLLGAVETAAGRDWAGLDQESLAGSVELMVRAHRMLEAGVACAMAAMSSAGVSGLAGGLSATSWWALRRLGHGGQGAWMVRAGELIEEFRELGAAVRQGELCLDHLRVLDEIRDSAVLAVLAGCEAELCRLARCTSLTNWRREIRRRVEAIRHDLANRDDLAGPSDDPGRGEPAEGDGRPGGGSDTDAGASDRLDSAPEGAPDGRFRGGGPSGSSGDGEGEGDTAGSHTEGATGNLPSGDDADAGERRHGADLLDEGWLSLRPTAEGAVIIRGELRGYCAEIVRQVLSAELSRQRRAAWREHDDTGAPIPSAGQLRARALFRLLGSDDAGRPRGSGPARSETVVVIEADDHTAGRVRSLDGEPISAEVAALLTCDAHLQALLVDQRGQPLWLGRITRLATASQRRVMAVRDGGCVFPGCDMAPEWCDAHHQPGWSQQGRTDIDTMVLLCRRHHAAAHSRHWQLRRAQRDRPPPSGSDESQRYEWIDQRTGAITDAQQRGIRAQPPTSATTTSSTSPGPAATSPGPVATPTGPAATSTGPAATSTGPAATSTGPAATSTGPAATSTAPAMGSAEPAASSTASRADTARPTSDRRCA